MALKLTKTHCSKIQSYANKIAGERVFVALSERTDGTNYSLNLLAFADDSHDESDRIWLSDAYGIELDFGEGKLSTLKCRFYEVDEYVSDEIGDLIDEFEITFERLNNKATIKEVEYDSLILDMTKFNAVTDPKRNQHNPQ